MSGNQSDVAASVPELMDAPVNTFQRFMWRPLEVRPEYSLSSERFEDMVSGEQMMVPIIYKNVANTAS